MSLKVDFLFQNFLVNTVGKNVTGNKVLSFRFLGLFSPKIIWGLPIMYQYIRSQELKSLRKKSLEKISLHKMDFFLHIELCLSPPTGVFIIKSLSKLDDDNS